jgi:N-acyl amino acid synthase of PEP-CTERM/exosortase system
MRGRRDYCFSCVSQWQRRPKLQTMSVTAVTPGVLTPSHRPPDETFLDGGLLTRFRVVPAVTDELRDEAFRIRHEVFCEGFNLFEPRPDRRETDEFDERAVQLLLKHTPSNEFIGCVRVVKGQPSDPSALLPFESVCRDLVDKELLDLDTLPRQLIGEVSRLGVIGKFRRRKGEDRSPVPLGTDAELEDSGRAADRRQFPHILVALYLGAYTIAQREGIEHLCTFTELRLFNHLVKLGLPIKVIGASIHHKGLRVPAVVNVSRIAVGLNPSVQAIYGQIVRDINSALE